MAAAACLVDDDGVGLAHPVAELGPQGLRLAEAHQGRERRLQLLELRRVRRGQGLDPDVGPADAGEDRSLEVARLEGEDAIGELEREVDLRDVLDEPAPRRVGVHGARLGEGLEVRPLLELPAKVGRLLLLPHREHPEGDGPVLVLEGLADLLVRSQGPARDLLPLEPGHGQALAPLRQLRRDGVLAVQPQSARLLGQQRVVDQPEHQLAPVGCAPLRGGRVGVQLLEDLPDVLGVDRLAVDRGDDDAPGGCRPPPRVGPSSSPAPAGATRAGAGAAGR